MANFISDGTGLTPSAPEHIGFSTDGLSWDLIPKSRVTVGGIFSTTPGVPYPFATKTILVITSDDLNKRMCELQNIKGGDLVAYNHGTKADLDTAVKTVASWVLNI